MSRRENWEKAEEEGSVEANLYNSGPYTDGDIEKAIDRHYSYVNANMIVSTCTSMLVLPALRVLCFSLYYHNRL